MTIKFAFAVILSAVVFSYYFIIIAGIPKKIKHKLKYPFHKRLKPFDCLTCLSVWTSAFFYFLPHELIYFIAIIFTTGIIGNYIIKNNENIG